VRENPLNVLLEDGVIDEVVGRLNSGKEADIYLVQHRGRVVAAKVYRDREHRSFKNNADYKEGRGVRSSRTQRAISSGSRYGRQAEEEEWGTTEARALHRLEAHGVRVPVAVMSYEGVLLMEVVTDAEGEPAPRLIEKAYSPADARAAYVDLRGQIVRMLCAEIVHGDLSPYNILAAAAGPTIIDFPQIVSAAHNSRAEFFFLRDYDNVHRFLSGFDGSLAASRDDGRQIWQAYVRRELTPEFVPSYHAPRPPPRRYEAPLGGGRPDARPYGPPRPQGGPPPNRDHRPQGGPPPNREGRPQGGPPPNREGRPQGGPPPNRDNRPQGGPPPNRDHRPQGGPPPSRDPRAPHPQGPARPQNPQHREGRPPNPPRPQGGAPAPQSPPALRNTRPKVYTSPDRPPRGAAPSPDDSAGNKSGSHRRRPKRRF